MKCKFCDGELNDEDKVCPNCGEPVGQTKICPHCNAEQSQESGFCKRCGWNFETNSMPHKYCQKCGSELKVDGKFCNKCGYDLLSKPEAGKKKRILPIVVAAVLIVGTIAGGTAYSYYMHQKDVKEAKEAQEAYEAVLEALREAERQRQEFIVSYQKKAIAVRDAIQEAKTNFSLMSAMFATSTEPSDSLFGSSFYTAYAERLCSGQMAAEKTRKIEIDKLYKELDAMKCNEKEVQELKKAMEDYYHSYCDRYDLLIEMDFSTSEFDLKESSSSSDFSTKEKTVNKIVSLIQFDEDESDITEDAKGGGTI